MHILLSFIPLLFLFVLHAAYVKLSAAVMGRSLVSWKHSFLFAGLVILVTLIERIGSVLTGISMPLTVALIYGIALQLALGSWFFSTRGTTRNGQRFGWRGGAQLSAITVALLGITFFGLQGIVRIAGIAGQP